MVKCMTSPAVTMSTLTATSNGFKKNMLQDCVEIQAGKLKGIFDPSQFGPGGRSLCITMPSKAVGSVARIVSPIEFESMSDLSQCHAWKRSLRISTLNKTLGQLIDSGDLKICDKKCNCTLCQKSNDYMSKKRRTSLNNRKDGVADDTNQQTIHSNSSKVENGLSLLGTDSKDSYPSNNRLHMTCDYENARPLDIVLVKEIEDDLSTARLQFPPLTSLLDSNIPKNTLSRLGNGIGRGLECFPIAAKRNRNLSDTSHTHDHTTKGRSPTASKAAVRMSPSLLTNGDTVKSEPSLPLLTPLNGHGNGTNNGPYKDSDSDSGISNISNLSNRAIQNQPKSVSEKSLRVNTPNGQSSSTSPTSTVLSTTPTDPTPSKLSSSTIDGSISTILSNNERYTMSPTPSTSRTSRDSTSSNLGVSSTSPTSAMPDYTSMVREAIASISMATLNDVEHNSTPLKIAENSSRLMIILYILRKYKPSEDINIIHTKVTTTLSLLERMGIVNKLKTNNQHEDDSDMEEEDHLRSRPEQSPSPKHSLLSKINNGNSSSKKKAAKNVAKRNSLKEETSSILSDTSSSPIGDLREKINAKKALANSMLVTSKTTNTTLNTPDTLKKKEMGKTLIGTKTSGSKCLDVNSKSPTQKLLKIKKTKDGSKKSLSNSAATKENQKSKLNKIKKVKKKVESTEGLKQKSPGDKNSKGPPVVRKYQLKRLSPELAAICGKKKLSRHDVVSRMWRYIKKKKLQDPDQRTTILCDDKLKALTQKPRIGQTDMLLCIGSHLTLLH